MDHAYGLAGELASALTAARRSAKLSAVMGQSAFDAVGQTLAQTGAARGRAVAAHRSLDALARRLGFDPSAYGDDRKDPDPGFFGASAADRDVAA